MSLKRLYGDRQSAAMLGAGLLGLLVIIVAEIRPAVYFSARRLFLAFVAGICCSCLTILVLFACHVRRQAGFNDNAPFPAAPRPQFAAELEKPSASPTRIPVYAASEPISRAVGELLETLLDKHVGSWYTKISSSTAFEDAVDRLIRTAAAEFLRRALSLDLLDLMISRVLPLVTLHLRDFGEAERAIRGLHLTRNVTNAVDLDQEIAAKYRDGQLHRTATIGSELCLQREHLRKAFTRVAPELVPAETLASRSVAILVREVVVCSVLLPLMQLLTNPETWNSLIERQGASLIQDRRTLRKLSDSLEKISTRLDESSASELLLEKLARSDNERVYERFIRSVQRCHDLAEARRLSNTINNIIKQKSGTDSVYLRRLLTGRRLLDQKIASLATLEAESAPPSMDHSRSRMIDLRQLLYNAIGLSAFMEFMERNRKMTFVQFWIQVDGLRDPLLDEKKAAMQWVESDHAELAKIFETFFFRPELIIPPAIRTAVQEYLDAGQSASMAVYLQARSAVFQLQSIIFKGMEMEDFPRFQQSDLFLKYLASVDDPTSPLSQPAPLTRVLPGPKIQQPTLRHSAASSSDLRADVARTDGSVEVRRSLDIGDRPLFDDSVPDGVDEDGFDSSSDPDSDEDILSRSFDGDLMLSIETPARGRPVSTKPLGERPKEEREKPNLASLGLVNTSSRIGVFADNDLFDDEQKFLEDEWPDADTQVKPADPAVIAQASPGDLGLPEAIVDLSMKIDRLTTQEKVLNTLSRKAELINDTAELRILSKTKTQLRLEIQHYELQRSQYVVQDSENALYGRVDIQIKSILVGRENDQEYAVYVVEMRRRAEPDDAFWTVARRYSEFHYLHRRLRAAFPSVRRLEFPRRRLMLKLQRDFLRRRQAALQRYMKELLAIPAVCSHRAFRSFLSSTGIVSIPSPTYAAERRDMVGRICTAVTEGMEEFWGNGPALDQLSVAGQALVSAAASQLFATRNDELPRRAESESRASNSMQPAELPPRAESGTKSEHMEPFVKPICDLFLETFDLQRGNNWLRGRAVVVVLHQLLGGTVERRLRDNFRRSCSDASVVQAITQIRALLFPQAAKNEQGPLDPVQSKKAAEAVLAALLPDIVGNVVGRANAQAAARRIVATMNNQRLNAHLAYSIFDEIVDILFPENG